jgi:hypothetical protein
MAISETAYLEMMWDRNECPTCHKVIPEGNRVGKGRKAKGGFCSLDCYAKYNALELAEKARRLKREEFTIE